MRGLKGTGFSLFAVLAALIISCARCASAAPLPVVAFSNFGPANSFDTQIGWGISSPFTNNGFRGQAQPFTPAITGNLSSIQVALGKNPSFSFGRTTFTIASDAAGIPGTVLESFPNIVPPANFGGSYAPVTINSTAQPVLFAGTQYWLTAEVSDNNSSSVWNYNNQNQSGLFAFDNSPWAWQAFTGPPRNGAFRINVVVPEPSLAAAVLGAFVLIRSRRRVRTV